MPRAWMRSENGWVSREPTDSDQRAFEIMAQWGEEGEDGKPIQLHKLVEKLTEAGLWDEWSGAEARHRFAEAERYLDIADAAKRRKAKAQCVQHAVVSSPALRAGLGPAAAPPSCAA